MLADKSELNSLHKQKHKKESQKKGEIKSRKIETSRENDVHNTDRLASISISTKTVL